jgi:ABC-type transport system involved in multi-copper enzyme maturation permease subunit
MKGIFTETLIEYLDRRQHWLMFFVTAVAAGIIYFAVAEKKELVENEISSQSALVQSAASGLGNFMTVLMILSIISAAFVVARMARKGRIEFYLSKPITRSSLYYGKMISLILIYSTLITLCGSIVAGTLSFQQVMPFSSSIFVVIMGLAAFLVWFSVIAFVGLITRSVSMCLTVFGGLWFIQLLLKHRAELGIEQKIFQMPVDALYYILPKTSEMSGISLELATGIQTINYLPIFTSLMLAGALIYGASIQFNKRDF